jgi:hypothetical protein
VQLLTIVVPCISGTPVGQHQRHEACGASQGFQVGWQVDYRMPDITLHTRPVSHAPGLLAIKPHDSKDACGALGDEMALENFVARRRLSLGDS